jgi:phosphate transport system substrate-binding protein
MFENTFASRRQFIALGAALAGVAGLGMSGKLAQPALAADALSGSVTAVGSTALQPLVEAAAEQFMANNSGVQISVQGGGSGQGITQIAAGTVQIGDSDVYAESKLDNPDDASKLIDNKVCVVGMGPVVNPDVTVKDIKMEDLAGIFSGSITNWADLGGNDEEIVVINRASGSGTRATFEDAVLKGVEVPVDFTPQEQDSSGTVAQMIASTPGAISYLAFSYYDDTMVALSVDGVEPTDENVATNDWKIWAYEHMYTVASPDAATAAFIEYMFSDDVQGSLVEKMGYIPVNKMKVEKDVDGNVTDLDGEASGSAKADSSKANSAKAASAASSK